MKKPPKPKKSKLKYLTGWERLLAEISCVTKSLYQFVKRAWKIVVRNHAFRDSWHVRVLCDHLQAVTEGKIQNLLINIPPRHTKSLIVSVFWPAWVWARNPSLQWLFGSRTQLISLRDNRKCRDLMQSNWYQDRFNINFKTDDEAYAELAKTVDIEKYINEMDFAGDQNIKSFYANTAGGHRIATSAGSQGTGLDADIIVVDDLHGINDTEDRITTDVQWCEDTLWSRGNTETAPRVVIGQRVRGNDISGHILSGKAGGEWVTIILPMEFVEERKCKTGLKNCEDGYILEYGGRKILFPGGFEDPRIVNGEILAPSTRSKAWAEEYREKKPGSHARLNQQNPTPAEGGIFKRRWMEKRFDVLAVEDVTMWGTSCDTPFRKGKNTDFYVHQLIAKIGLDYYIVAQERGRKSYDEMETAYEAFLDKWEAILGVGTIKKNLIEGKASGDALIAKFQAKFQGVVPFEPGNDSKELRFELASPTVRAGHLVLPAENAIITRGGRLLASLDTNFVPGLVEEMATVPNADHDDIADTITQFILDDQDPNQRAQETMPNVALLGAAKKTGESDRAKTRGRSKKFTLKL